VTKFFSRTIQGQAFFFKDFQGHSRTVGTLTTASVINHLSFVLSKGDQQLEQNGVGI